MALASEYKDPKFRQAFLDIYAVKGFLTKCLVPRGYKPPDDLANAIVLSDHGITLLNWLTQQFPAVEQQWLRVALFVQFGSRRPFVDVEHTDSSALISALDAEICQRHIILPLEYGRELYDKYFELIGQEKDELDYDETQALLTGTSAGVFQNGRLVVGPFGVIRSAQLRLMSPTRSAALWHCPDLACRKLHSVRLKTGENGVGQAIRELDHHIQLTEGPSSDWYGFFKSLIISQQQYYDANSGISMPWLLATGITLEEIRIVLTRALTAYGRDLRSTIEALPPREPMLRGSAAEIAGRLDHWQIFQLLLSLTDEQLVFSLESEILAKSFTIPPTEIRTPFVTSNTNSVFRLRPEASQFGVRFEAADDALAMVRLDRMLRKVYHDTQGMDDLEWRLRHVGVGDVHTRLDAYLHSVSPEEALRNLLFATKSTLTAGFAWLRWGVFELPETAEAEESLVSRILWKLGFDLPSYPTYQNEFWCNYSSFISTLPDRELAPDDRSTIRSATTNLFVSLEDILDRSLAFITWALFHDHYGWLDGPAVVYNSLDARRFSFSVLNEWRNADAGDQSLLDISGRNTLSPLLNGFRTLADRIDLTLKDPGEADLRAESELPDIAVHGNVTSALFRHTLPVLDLRTGDARLLSATCRDLARSLAAVDVPAVRNRLSHQRSDFPGIAELRAAASALEEWIGTAERLGIVPVVYNLVASKSDRFRRRSVRMADWKGGEIELLEFDSAGATGLPSYFVPQIIVPNAHLGHTAEVLRFIYQEPSPYSTLLKGYPRRLRRLLLGDEATPMDR